MTEREPLAPEPLFERLAVRLLADPAVTPGTGFGSALGSGSGERSLPWCGVATWS
jgi:hypothetical protein